jgi:hypothetical protein
LPKGGGCGSDFSKNARWLCALGSTEKYLHYMSRSTTSPEAMRAARCRPPVPLSPYARE